MGKENVNLVNKMRNYKDPLLAAFDIEMSQDTQETQDSSSKKTTQSNKQKVTEGESGSDDSNESSSGDDSSSEEDTSSQIKFPKDNAQDLLQFISRDLTNIQNKEDGQKRKFSLIRLYQIFVISK